MTPYLPAFLLIFLLCSPAVSADPEITLRVRLFPPEAEVLFHGQVLRPHLREDSWREYRVRAESTPIVLSAPGYEDRPVHLLGAPERVILEERLLPRGGILRLAGEFPTGGAPKSVSFLPENRILVPLLRDRGADLFSWSRREGALVLDHLGPVRIGNNPGEAALVESLVLPRRREVWISRMDPDELHRFDLSSLEWLGSLSSGGNWPKVMVTDRGEGRVYVANWLSETVGIIDPVSGTVTATIPVGGQPRGLWLSPEGRFLWVCLFSTGEIEVIDLERGVVAHRLGLPPGAARHIVASPEGRVLYYSDMYHGTVGAIDRERRVVTHTRRVGPNVNTIAADPRGEFLFVSVRGRNNAEDYLLPGPEHGRIVVLDARTLDEKQSIWARRQPTGLAVSPDGTLLAATDFLDDNLAIYEIRR